MYKNYAKVLNLVINGWPSILITFVWMMEISTIQVLNLVINGWPSIRWKKRSVRNTIWVLNLVINGWPSIHKHERNWRVQYQLDVLNLVINGWPSILSATSVIFFVLWF